MWAFTLRRLFYAVPVLLCVSMLVFALIHLAPGDVVDILVPPEVPKDIADSLRAQLTDGPPPPDASQLRLGSAITARLLGSLR